MDSRQLAERLVREHRVAVRIAQRVLARFKAAFPQRHLVAWTNSVVEITTIGVQVWPAQGNRLVRDTYLAFNSDDWQTRRTSALEQNARRGTPHVAG
jgi:hypothetical protein